MNTSQRKNNPNGQNPGQPPQGKGLGGLGCEMLLLFVAGVPASIILAFSWDCPGSSPLAELLWNDARLPWVMGVLLTSIGLYIYALEKVDVTNCHTPVTAVIADIVVAEETSNYMRGGYHTYTPIYAYTLNQEEIRVRSRYASTNKDKYHVGQEVKILVAPGLPDLYCLEKKSARTLLVGKIVAGIGIPLGVIGLVMWIASLVILFIGGELF